MIPMPILTPRMILNPLHPDDAADIYTAKRESWDTLSRWGIWIFKPFAEMSVADDEEFCRRKQALFDERKDITLSVRDRETGNFLGGAGLHKCDWEQRTVSLGFWIRSSEINKGYATEVAATLVRYAFDSLGAIRIESLHAEGNTTSQRVLEKIGFLRLGVAKKAHSLPSGTLVDELRYVLEAPP